MGSSSRSKDHRRSEKHRSEKRERYDDDDEQDRKRHRRERDRDRDGPSSRKTKARDRDNSERKRSRRNDNHNEDEDDSRGDRMERSREKSRSKHKHHHSSSREGSSSKRRKSSRRHEDEDSNDGSSNDDRYDSEDSRSRERRRRRKKSSKSHKDKKKKKEKKKSSKEDTSHKSKPDKSTLVSMGEPRGKAPDSPIDPKEDYFSYHQEFWVYLFREEGTCFNDLETKDSHEAFRRFAKAYNAGKLEDPYYTRTFPSAVIEESKTTKHSWEFKTTRSERQGLDDLQKGIRKQTEYTGDKPPVQNKAICQIVPASATTASAARAPPDGQMRLTVEERLQKRRDDKRLRDEVRLVHEELTGGPKDHRERKLEQKREHSAKIHGAHGDREGQAAGVELSDADLFGGDNFASAVAKSRQRQQHKDERRKSRIEELQSKEKERQANMLKMLGLGNLQGRKVEIAPRKDPP